MKNSTTLSRVGLFSGGVLFIFLGWIILSSLMNNDLVYPSLLEIFKSFFTLLFTDNNLLLSGLFSLLRVVLVIIISLIVSIIISYIYILYRDSIYFLKPIMVLIKSTPLAIISVYLWIALGSEKAPYLITLLMVLPVMIEGFITAIDQIDNAYILQLKTEDISHFKKFYKIYIPLIFPYIIMTLLQTFGLGIKVMLMGEYICQTSSSIGGIIYTYKQTLEFNNLIAIALYIIIIVIVLESLIKFVYKKINA